MSGECILGLVLHHGRPAAVRRCLSSLAMSSRPPDHVLLVDNGAGDGAELTRGTPFTDLDLRLVTAPRNLGYAGGVNLGLDAAATLPWDRVLLLNDDAMVAEECLARLLAAAAERPGAGLLGAEIRQAGTPRRLESTGLSCSPLTGRVRSLGSGRRASAAPGPPRSRQALSGCALLIQREVVARTGGPDPDYFLYFEDLDWSVRAARAGFELLFVPGAVVYHEGGRLGGARRVYYSTRNQLRVLERLHPLSAPATALRRLTIAALNLAAVPRTARHTPLAGLRAWRDGLRDGLAGRVGPYPEAA